MINIKAVIFVAKESLKLMVNVVEQLNYFYRILLHSFSLD
jgi:hypothetical protein